MSKARVKYEHVKLMDDDKLYKNCIDIIDQNMNDLRKKQLREMLIYKANQAIK